MNLVKLSCLALAVAAASTQLAMAGQADAKGFVEDSELNLLNRNYYFNRDFRDSANRDGVNNSKPASERKGYREEWAHGVMAEFASGFTQGTVGFGVDAYGYLGLKLDSGRGRTGTGLLPISNNRTADAEVGDEYAEAGGAVKLRVSETVLKYGEMRTEAPVFATSHSRLLPETATGFHVASGEIDGLSLEAGHFTAYNERNSTNSDEDLYLNYGSGEIGKTIDFAGGWYSVNDDLSLGLYTSRFEDTWNQHYGNLNYTLGISEGQSLNFDFNLYRTTDTGKSLQGDIDNTTYSLAATYGLGSHSILLAYQRVDGDTPFDYVGGDSIFLANSMQYSDFNAPNEKSWRIGYGYDWAGLGIPGLTTKVTYVTGSDIDGTDADVNGGYFEYYGADGEHRETDIDIKYVVQEGPAKDLSIRLRQAFHRANADQGEGDINEFRVIVDYPLSIL
ncbi:OprD family porin [Pseudomonas sp. WS 5013]|uniref:Outer membrane porin, OprD family n=1 Tax=Aquipseudomonas alcaligenes TaxID=43263 RepID=A0A2V4LC17_AQUAC|nr:MULTISPECIES: OprD family porin [Pseudomonas]NMY40749.1 OprD family porin [Pseudomonas sp. WS 5013]PYC28194.1 outer membrane porin, OprD family [Pseudomonas alcaligenes]